MQHRGGIQQRLARDKRPPIASNVALFLIRAWAWGEISPQFVQKVRCAFVIRSACKMTAPPQTKSPKIVSRSNQKQLTEMVPRNDTYNGFRKSPQNMFDEIVPTSFSQSCIKPPHQMLQNAITIIGPHRCSKRQPRTSDETRVRKRSSSLQHINLQKIGKPKQLTLIVRYKHTMKWFALERGLRKQPHSNIIRN